MPRVSPSKRESRICWKLLCDESQKQSNFLTLPGMAPVATCTFQKWRREGGIPTLCHCPLDLAILLALNKPWRHGEALLPYYWPRRSDGPSTSHSLCSLPLHAELKTSICSSKIVQTAATRGKYHKNRILKTNSHMLNSLLFLPGHSTSNKQI